MDGHSHHTASRDLGHTFGSQLVLSLLADINVASNLCASTRVHDVLCDLGVTNNGRILLARRDGSAVTSKVLVDC